MSCGQDVFVWSNSTQRWYEGEASLAAPAAALCRSRRAGQSQKEEPTGAPKGSWADFREHKIINQAPYFLADFRPPGPRELRERPRLEK